MISTHTDSKLAGQIVAAVFNTAVHLVTPIADKGSVNLIFVAHTTDGDVVVRMSRPEDYHRGLRFYQKEQWCLAQAAALGIPGPQALAVGEWHRRPYMLQSRVGGVNGEDSPVASQVIWHSLGRYARLIHSVELDGFGEYLTDFHSGQAQFAWRRFVDYNLTSLTDDPLLRLGVYTPDQADAIRSIFHMLRETPFRFGLNHNDLAPRNTVVDVRGTVHLLDWGSAEAHIVPHYDLLEILRWHSPMGDNFRAFLAGYGMDAAEFAHILPQVRDLAVLKAFDLTRWAIDRRPDRIPEMAARAHHALQIRLGVQPD